MTNEGGNTVPRITKAEHIGPNDTGDNIEAKRVVGYVWNGSTWERPIFGMFTKPYDELDWSNADANGNYQTITSKLFSSAQQTLTIVYDGSNNITSIIRS